MTPVLHHQSPPRAPVCHSGSALPQYGKAGDTCACGALLSAYNDYDACHTCIGLGAPTIKRPRRAPASECSEAAPTSAPGSRHISMEEVEMEAEKRRKYGAVKEAVLVAMGDGDWHGCVEVSDAIGCSSSTASYHMKSMAEAGRLEMRPGPTGGHQYRMRESHLSTLNSTESSVDSVPEDAPAPSQAPAPEPVREPVAETATPVTPPPESPAAADEEEIVDQRPAAARTFGGSKAGTVYVDLKVGDPHDREVRLLDDLAQLDEAARERVLQYAVSRWWPRDERRRDA